MKISWIPAYNKTGASSRIRVFYPHETLGRFFTKEIDSYIGHRKDADVLIVQKDLNRTIHNQLEGFKGIKIFDFLDDNTKPQLRSVADKVTFFTTPTSCNKKRLESFGIKTPCFVINDCIDYGINSAYEAINSNNDTCWFGNIKCRKSIRWMIPVITSQGYSFTNIKWKLDSLIKDLREYNVCILSHRYTSCKSNNKMTVAISCGLPCIVNDSQSYTELVNLFNLQYSDVQTEEELIFALGYLNNIENRKKYLKDIQPYIIENYNSLNVTKKLLTIIDSF